MLSLATDALQSWIWQAADPLLVFSKCIQEKNKKKNKGNYSTYLLDESGESTAVKKASLSLL